MGNAYLAITGHTAIYERTIEQVYADGSISSSMA
jgi:hypothetical protein